MSVSRPFRVHFPQFLPHPHPLSVFALFDTFKVLHSFRVPTMRRSQDANASAGEDSAASTLFNLASSQGGGGGGAGLRRSHACAVCAKVSFFFSPYAIHVNSCDPLSLGYSRVWSVWCEHLLLVGDTVNPLAPETPQRG